MEHKILLDSKFYKSFLDVSLMLFFFLETA